MKKNTKGYTPEPEALCRRCSDSGIVFAKLKDFTIKTHEFAFRCECVSANAKHLMSYPVFSDKHRYSYTVNFDHNYIEPVKIKKPIDPPF